MHWSHTASSHALHPFLTFLQMSGWSSLVCRFLQGVISNSYKHFLSRQQLVRSPQKMISCLWSQWLLVRTYMTKAFFPPGGLPWELRNQILPNGTGIASIQSWTTWPACCHFHLTSSPSWTSFLSCVSALVTSG